MKERSSQTSKKTTATPRRVGGSNRGSGREGGQGRVLVEAVTEEGRQKQRHWQRLRLRESQRQQELSSFYFIVGKVRVVVAVLVAIFVVAGNVAFCFWLCLAS